MFSRKMSSRKWCGFACRARGGAGATGSRDRGREKELPLSNEIDEYRRKLAYGLVPAVPTPFDADGGIAAAALDGYIATLLQQPISGVALVPAIARTSRMTAEQQLQVVGAWRRGMQRGGSKAVLIAGVSASAEVHDVDGAIRAVETAARATAASGADCLLVHPAAALKGGEDEDTAVAYHRAAAAAGRPLILSCLDGKPGGITYGAGLLYKLFAIPEVMGIRVGTLDNIATFQDAGRAISESAPQMLLFSGEERFTGYSLMCGARALMTGLAAICTQLQHYMMRAWFEGRPEEFLELSHQSDKLGQVFFGDPTEGAPQRILWGLARRGLLDEEGAFDPWAPMLPADEPQTVRQALFDAAELDPAAGTAAH
jgi:4-hydroxy-tetrahydrodipicolinate synthase